VSRSEALVAAIAARPRRVALGFCVALILAVLSVGQATGWRPGELPQDNRLEVWFVADDPVVTSFRRFQKDYRLGEPVVVALHDPEGVFRPESLNLIATLSKSLARQPRVRGVSSLATVLCARGDPASPDEITVDPLYTAVSDARQAESIRALALADPVAKTLVNADATTTILGVQLEQVDDFDRERSAVLGALNQAIQAALQEGGRGPSSWSWGGPGLLHQASNAATKHETDRLSGLSAAVLLLVLALCFRRVAPVVLVLTSVISATILLGGVALWLGHRFNLVTAVLPTLVLVVGVIDSVYFVTAFRQERAALEAQGLERPAVVARALGSHVLPGLFNSITTAVGFLSFVGTRMDALRQLGALAGVGVGLAFGCSLVVCTLGLSWFDAGYPPERGRGLDRALEGLAGWVTARPRRVLAGALLLGALAGLGAMRLEVDTHTFNAFGADHPLRQAHERIEGAFGPYMPLETIVESESGESLLRPEVLSAMVRIETEVPLDEPLLEEGASVATVVKQLHGLVAGPDAEPIPSVPGGVDQLLLLHDLGREDDPLAPFGDPPTWSQARLTFRVGLTSTGKTSALLERVQSRSATLLPEGVRLRVAGYASLYTALNGYLLEGLLISLALSALLVFVLVACLFRSFRYAALALVPNLLPALVVLGFMGACGLTLDPTNAMIGTLVLCVAVDDTVHLLYRFRASYARSGQPREACREVLRTTGRAITYSSLAVACGIGVLASASIQTVASFGLLTALAMGLALFAELVITPALAVLVFPERPPESSDPPAGPEVA